MIAFIAGFGLALILVVPYVLDYRHGKNQTIQHLTDEISIQRQEKEAYKAVSPFRTTNADWRVCTEQPEMHILDRKPIGRN